MLTTRTSFGKSEELVAAFYKLNPHTQLKSRMDIIVMLMQAHLHLRRKCQEIFSAAAAASYKSAQILISRKTHLRGTIISKP